MKKTSAEWSIRMLVDLEGRIDLDAEYQRGNVWSTPQRRLLIDSILRGYDIPKIYLRQLPSGSQYRYEVVDGKQRLTTLWMFFNNEFNLPRSSTFPELGAMGGKFASDLSQAAHDQLAFASVTVSIIEEATEDEVAELFLRLQKGEPLKAAEKRNAIRGPVRDFIADDLSKHEVYGLINLPSKRFGLHELAAIALLLCLHETPVSIKGADLNDLYEQLEFDPDGEAATDARSALDDLATVATHNPGYIRTRWGYVDLLLCLRRLRQESVDWEPTQVQAFFESFEAERLSASSVLNEFRQEASSFDAADLGQNTELAFPDVESDMFVYVESFAREGATAAAIRTRSDVMYHRLRQYLSEG